MTYPTIRRSLLMMAGALVAGLASACRDAQGPGANRSDVPVQVLPVLIVSNPTVSVLAPGAAALSGSAGLVYISIPPESIPSAARIAVRNRQSGAQATATFVNGGFDPIPISALAGDTLDVQVHLTGINGVREYISVVPIRRPPVVVRTDPPPGRRDVPLNARMRVVLSEPIDPVTLTTSSVQLVGATGSVPGTIDFADDANLVLTFTPDGPLAPGADYTLLVTQSVEDRDGDPLQWALSLPFSTLGVLGPVAAVYERQTPHIFPGYHSRYVLRVDGSFELQYETTTWGNFAYTGQYTWDSIRIGLYFDANRYHTMGPWDAVATLEGDSLDVSYSLNMQMADFENGVYAR